VVDTRAAAGTRAAEGIRAVVDIRVEDILFGVDKLDVGNQEQLDCTPYLELDQGEKLLEGAAEAFLLLLHANL